MLSTDDVIDLMGRERIVFAQQAVLTAKTRTLRDKSTENSIDFKRQAGVSVAPGL